MSINVDAARDDSTPCEPPELSASALACNGCRRAKLRCTRDRPACQHCRKTAVDCVYEPKRSKPGIKSGAVENVHRRLDALEQLVRSREDIEASSIRNDHNPNQCRETAAYDILQLLAEQLPKLVSNASHRGVSHSPGIAISNGRKRRRKESELSESNDSEGGERPPMPDQNALEAIIDTYFSHIHPWIPMIHRARFQERLANDREYEKLTVLVHAMTMSTSKFIDNTNSSMWPSRRTRKWVISTAMDSLAVENLQALIIVAFSDIGDGNAENAWSIIGSLTRTVEYLQLTVEHDESDTQPLFQPFTSLNATQDWTELEERRRVFWNVFKLDRVCSVMMGWNTSLTSDDVQRRLPCDGILWRKQQPVVTPYFGIWNKSAARIGNSIAFIPSHFQSSGCQPTIDTDTQNQPDGTSPSGASGALDMSTVGAFAYCIEATESMSRITSYFLQQKINLRDQKEINSWLIRFKELDLRLVHWKMLLPHKWKANMESQTTRMDPNLTLAHVTHNASMILLHQLIAYPPLSWEFRNRLPSSWSAETCMSAAVEIATITNNYLRCTPRSLPLASQYAFCIFVASRIMLVHWRYCAGNQLPDEFWSLVQSLEETSRRWTSSGHRLGQSSDLAAKYALKLREYHELCSKDGNYRVDVVGYTQEINHHSLALPQNSRLRQEILAESRTAPNQRREQAENSNGQWHYSPTATAENRLSDIGMQIPVSIPQPISSPGTLVDLPDSIEASDFNVLLKMPFDQQFINMDRVITFDDGSMFTTNLDSGGW